MIGTDSNAIRKVRLFFASQLLFIAFFQFSSMNTLAQTTIAGPKGLLAARATARTSNFEASFSYQPGFPIVGQTVQFMDASVGGPTSWLWDFGDGSTGTGRNPQHIYKNTGFQRVTLLVSNSTGYKKAIKTIAVISAPAATSDISSFFQFSSMNTQAQTTKAGPKGLLAARATARTSNFEASFSYQPGFPMEGQTVQFMDASVGGPTSWLWDFGDGSTGTGRNPQHIYKNTGFQRVTLLVSNSTGYKKAIKTIAVISAPAATSDIASLLSASFAYAPTSPIAGQTVQFTDTSSGAPASWKWIFGDGSSSTVQNPAHNFENAGFYDVALTVTRGNETKSVSRTVTIVPAAPQPSFTFSPSSPVAEQSVQFTDTSAGSPDSWQWDFNDGSTSSQQNPSHIFATGGSYNVSLTVANSSGSNIFSSAINVMPATPETDGYYVESSNPKASDSNPGTAALPWKTLTKANQTLVAGDTVFIKAGTYTTHIAPSNSGTASSPISYKAYGSDAVTIRDAAYGILLDGKDYITVQGINFYNLDKFMYLINGANHNTISYCNFDKMRTYSGWAGSIISYNSSYNWIHHCRWSKYGYHDSDDHGSLLEIGREATPTETTGHNLIEDCSFYNGGHHLVNVMGLYNVIRNNYFHHEAWYSYGGTLYGDRCVMFSGALSNSGRNLFEGNRVAYSSKPPDSIGSSGMSIASSYNIVRFNQVYNNNLVGISLGSGGGYYGPVKYNKIYNNTLFNNSNNPAAAYDSAISFTYYTTTKPAVDQDTKLNCIKNNIMYKHSQQYYAYDEGAGGHTGSAYQTFAGNWNGDTQGNPQFVSASEVLGNPSDSSTPNFHLMSTSPCKDSGTFLTTITSASGSGVVIKVADAGYFMDGWGIPGVAGDTIQIVGTSQKARITKIDYGTNTITVNTTLTWTQGQGLALAYLGAAPDAGAFEYGK